MRPSGTLSEELPGSRRRDVKRDVLLDLRLIRARRAAVRLTMVAEGRSSRGGADVVKKGRRDSSSGRRDSSSRRRLSGGVSVRRRVRAVDATAPAPPLQRLLAACRRAFGGPGTVPAPDDVALIRGILDKMRPEDVHLSAVTKAAAASGVEQRRRRRPIITRTTIYECTSFSVVVFLLPPGAVIPLHDHPGMTVFSKLLLGSLHVTSYDWADDGPTPASGGGAPATPPRLARLVLDADLRAPCGALVLFPESGGNMHRLAASTACAVLDVLGPPYSAGERDCTYYQDLPYSHRLLDRADDEEEAAGVKDDNDDDARGADDDDEHRRRRARRRCLGWWLVETGKPEELEMYEVPYKGPPIL